MHPTIAALRLQWQLRSPPPVADFERLPKVGGMASIPTRAHNLPAVLAEVLPQVERLHLFLHGYTEIPDSVRLPKVIPYLAPKSHPYRASGKFYGLAQETAPCIYVGFDDDILYRAGHVARLLRALRRYRGRAIVGVHGIRYLSADATFRTRRRSYFFERALLLDHQVDVLGTGTVAFVSSQYSIDPPAWPHGDMDDLMAAQQAELLGLPRIAIARPARSIQSIETNQDDSLWRVALNDNTRHTEQLHILLELMGKRPKR
jgi:hypothetical protein